MTEHEIPDERPWRKREYSGAGSTLGVAALVILVVAVGVWFLEFRGESRSGGSQEGFGIVELPDDLNATGKNAVAELGRAAPNFRLYDTSGNPVELTDFRGKPVLVNFWATWCGPCAVETPEFESVFREGYLVVLGVNQQETLGDIESFVEKYSVTYPMLMDNSAEVANAYRAPGLPYSLLLDEDGVVRRQFISTIDREDLHEALAELQQ